MSLPTQTRVFILKNKPTDYPVLQGANPTFSLQTQDLPPLQDDQILIQTLYLSNDPAQRGWIDKYARPERLYVPPVPEGAPMRARGICKVLESKASGIQKGALVLALCGWSEYTVQKAGDCQPVQAVPGLSPTHYLGALGLPGLTAYFGLIEVVGAKEGESVVVSGAAGATGSMVVQIAKHIVGCGRVIGIAGSDEKCRWVESLGADVCVNYKNSNWEEQLKKATDGFVDIYFDNVGGEQLDLMLTRLKRYGRVAACGAISSYNRGDKPGLKNWQEVIIQRLNIKGFVVLDYVGEGKGAKATNQLIEAVKAGKIRIADENETVVDTKFEDVPKTWIKLFEGGNTGKLVTKIV